MDGTSSRRHLLKLPELPAANKFFASCVSILSRGFHLRLKFRAQLSALRLTRSRFSFIFF